jgi:hypothetical protein
MRADHETVVYDRHAEAIAELAKEGSVAADSLEDMRAEEGYIHADPAGAGHFVKMVHNGIQYGLMQAYAEGFDILKGKSSDTLPPKTNGSTGTLPTLPRCGGAGVLSRPGCPICARRDRRRRYSPFRCNEVRADINCV